MNIRYLTIAILGVIVLTACGNDKAGTTTIAPPARPLTAADAARLVEPLPAPWNTADYRAGAVTYAKCRNCHALEADASSTIGPNLHGTFTRKPGSLPDYRYSPAMKAFSKDYPYESWTPAEIDTWLADPDYYLPDSGMFFDGLSDEFERRNLIAYLLIETAR